MEFPHTCICYQNRKTYQFLHLPVEKLHAHVSDDQVGSRYYGRYISLKMIAGAAGAKILKQKSSKHGFPMQKQCFGSVSETFSTAKPCKILKKRKKKESGPLKDPP